MSETPAKEFPEDHCEETIENSSNNDNRRTKYSQHQGMKAADNQVRPAEPWNSIKGMLTREHIIALVLIVIFLGYVYVRYQEEVTEQKKIDAAAEKERLASEERIQQMKLESKQQLAREKMAQDKEKIDKEMNLRHQEEITKQKKIDENIEKERLASEERRQRMEMETKKQPEREKREQDVKLEREKTDKELKFQKEQAEREIKFEKDKLEIKLQMEKVEKEKQVEKEKIAKDKELAMKQLEKEQNKIDQETK